MVHYGLKAIQPDRVISKQIEAARSSVNKAYEKTRQSLDKSFSKHTSI